MSVAEVLLMVRVRSVPLAEKEMRLDSLSGLPSLSQTTLASAEATLQLSVVSVFSVASVCGARADAIFGEGSEHPGLGSVLRS